MEDARFWKQRLVAPVQAWMRPWMDRLPEEFPSCAALNALLDARTHGTASGHAIGFVPAGELPPQLAYEAHVWQTGEVATRERNWHDLFNALAWLAFPLTKRALNRLHQAHSDAAAPGRRGTARDVLTLFDESGVVVMCADDTLAELLRGFQWKRLFWERRADVIGHMRFTVLGHALQEQALRPYPGITGKALILHCNQDWLRTSPQCQLQQMDAWVAERLQHPDTLATTRSLTPLPLLGIPGWDSGNAAAAYYDNRSVFRPGRR